VFVFTKDLGTATRVKSALIEVGTEHRLADEESLAMMVRVVKRAATRDGSP
jgi:hypothetical protein